MLHEFASNIILPREYEKVETIMKIREYIGKILPDGHLSLPDEVQKELGLGPHSSVKVTITVEDPRVLDEKKGWEAFRRLGEGATGSGLSDVSVKHDQYLYRKSKWAF